MPMARFIREEVPDEWRSRLEQVVEKSEREPLRKSIPPLRFSDGTLGIGTNYCRSLTDLLMAVIAGIIGLCLLIYADIPMIYEWLNYKVTPSLISLLGAFIIQGFCGYLAILGFFNSFIKKPGTQLLLLADRSSCILLLRSGFLNKPLMFIINFVHDALSVDFETVIHGKEQFHFVILYRSDRHGHRKKLARERIDASALSDWHQFVARLAESVPHAICNDDSFGRHDQGADISSVRVRAFRRMIWSAILASPVIAYMMWKSVQGWRFYGPGVGMPLVPFLYFLTEFTTGVPFHDLSRRWDDLKGWQRGILGTVIVIIAGFILVSLIIHAALLWQRFI